LGLCAAKPEMPPSCAVKSIIAQHSGQISLLSKGNIMLWLFSVGYRQDKLNGVALWNLSCGLIRLYQYA
jgi:hypothetical protein